MCVLTCQRPVHGDEKAVAASRSGDDSSLVEDEGAEAGGRSAQGRVDDGLGDGEAVSLVGDGSLLGAVAGEEPEDEDEAAQGRQGHRVAGHRHRPTRLVEAAVAGTHQHAAHQGAHRASQVHHGRSSKVSET